MKTLIHSCIAILMAILSHSAIANPCDEGGIGGTGVALSRGIGGTGITSKSTGIGGTGITSAQKGIGGTGIQANSGIGGTGIVGVITGFGSICVNNLEVHYFTDTPVDLDGKQISSQALSVGQVVAVKASGNEQALIAQEIHAFHQITGPITAIDAAGKKLKVMGQTVNANNAQLNNMQVGQWVSVSGLRNDDGSVEASRIDQSIEQKIARTVGNPNIQGNKVYVGGTKIDGVSKISSTNADTRFTGVWDGNTFNVKDMSPGPVSDLLQRVDSFHLQGIASSNVTNGLIKFAGQQIAVTGKTQMAGKGTDTNLIGKTVIVRGQIKEGKPTAQSIELQPLKTEHSHQHESKSAPVSTKASNESREKAQSRENSDHELVKPETLKDAENFGKSEKSKKLDKIDKVEKINKADKIEKVEKIEKIEPVEKIERIERAETIERVERVERAETY